MANVSNAGGMGYSSNTAIQRELGNLYSKRGILKQNMNPLPDEVKKLENEKKEYENFIREVKEQQNRLEVIKPQGNLNSAKGAVDTYYKAKKSKNILESIDTEISNIKTVSTEIADLINIATQELNAVKEELNTKKSKLSNLKRNLESVEGRIRYLESLC